MHTDSSRLVAKELDWQGTNMWMFLIVAVEFFFFFLRDRFNSGFGFKIYFLDCGTRVGFWFCNEVIQHAGSILLSSESGSGFHPGSKERARTLGISFRTQTLDRQITLFVSAVRIFNVF